MSNRAVLRDACIKLREAGTRLTGCKVWIQRISMCGTRAELNQQFLNKGPVELVVGFSGPSS